MIYLFAEDFWLQRLVILHKKVGMSVGLLFHYFESKAKLYEELIKIGVSGPKIVMTGDQINPIMFFENAEK